MGEAMGEEARWEEGRLVLRGGRVVLREQLPADARLLTAGLPGALVWIDGVPGAGSVTAARMMVKAADAGRYAPGWGLFAIQRAADAVAIGGIGFHGPPADGAVEVGYDLSVSARGAGWATEALRVLAGWALRQPGVSTVMAATAPENTPSQRVLDRVGFTRVADRAGLRRYELSADRP